MTQVNFSPLEKNQPMSAAQTMKIVIIGVLLCSLTATMISIIFGASALPRQLIPDMLVVPILLLVLMYFVQKRLANRLSSLKEFASINGWEFYDTNAGSRLFRYSSKGHYLIKGKLNSIEFSLYIVSGLENAEHIDPQFSYKTLLKLPSSKPTHIKSDSILEHISSGDNSYIHTTKLLISPNDMENLFINAGLL